MFRNQYDTDVTTWSPVGRLHQVIRPSLLLSPRRSASLLLSRFTALRDCQPRAARCCPHTALYPPRPPFSSPPLPSPSFSSPPLPSPSFSSPPLPLPALSLPPLPLPALSLPPRPPPPSPSSISLQAARSRRVEPPQRPPRVLPSRCCFPTARAALPLLFPHRACCPPPVVSPPRVLPSRCCFPTTRAALPLLFPCRTSPTLPHRFLPFASFPVTPARAIVSSFPLVNLLASSSLFPRPTPTSSHSNPSSCVSPLSHSGGYVTEAFLSLLSHTPLSPQHPALPPVPPHGLAPAH
ncbi:unnamed protein product, partial [Closterium sp. Naga37s-1]